MDQEKEPCWLPEPGFSRIQTLRKLIARAGPMPLKQFNKMASEGFRADARAMDITSCEQIENFSKKG